MQLALQRSQAIVDNISDAVITISVQRLVEWFNRAAASIFGDMPTEVLGGHVSMMKTGFHRKRHDGYRLRLQRTAEPRIIGRPRDLEARRKDGSVFPMNLSVSEIACAGRITDIGLTAIKINLQGQELGSTVRLRCPIQIRDKAP